MCRAHLLYKLAGHGEHHIIGEDERKFCQRSELVFAICPLLCLSGGGHRGSGGGQEGARRGSRGDQEGSDKREFGQ
jgi:hypothetical protein